MSLKINPITGQFDLVLDKAEEIKLNNGALSATNVDAGFTEIAGYIDTLQNAPKEVINYISYPIGGTSEGNAGWGLGKTTLTNKFPSGSYPGTIPSAGFSFTSSTTDMLGKYGSFVYANSSAMSAGDFVYTPFIIDTADKGKVLTVNFDYKVKSGTVDMSGTSTNTFGIAIRNTVTNEWIMPAGVWGMTQSSGAGRAIATFQTHISVDYYSLIIFVANSTAGPVSLLIDRVSVSPTTLVQGTPVTDWQSYVPTFTGFGTVTNSSFQWRRVGSNLEVRGRFTVGTPTAVEARLSLPSGLTSVSTIATLEKVGSADRSGGFASGYYYPTVLIEPSITYMTFGVQESVNPALLKRLGNAVFSTGENVSLIATIPIAGWSSQVQMSNDTDTRVISFTGSQSSQAVTAGVTNIAFTASIDRAGAWNGSQYIVPVSGDYVVSGSVNIGGGSVQVYKNGSPYLSNGYFSSNSGSAVSAGSILLIGCVAGDTISVRPTVTTTATLGTLSIYRLSGPAVIAATETVAAKYTSTATTGVANTVTKLTYATKVIDTHNTMVGDTYTAPVSGLYKVSGMIQLASNSWSTGALELRLYKNGSLDSQIAYFTQATGSLASSTMSASGSTLLQLNAGDTLTFYGIQSQTASIALSGSAQYNFIIIERLK